MSNSTPPGWYPVPGADGTAGHERWWDGNAWTSDVRPVQAGGAQLADAPTQAWQPPAQPAPAQPPAYGYGAPNQGQPGYGYPAQGQAGYGYPQSGGYPPPPSGRMKPGVAVGIGLAVLAVVGIVAAVALTSGGGTPKADPTPTVTVTTTGTPSPSPSPTRRTPSPTPTPTPTERTAPPPVLKDTVADKQHSITVPIYEGWDAQSDTTHSTVFLGSGRYACPGGGSCIRGQFSIEKDTIQGASARAAAEAAMPTYAAAIFTGITSHTDAGSSNTTVAGISGYAVRWHVKTSDGTQGYILMVAVPAKGGGFVAFEGGVDDDPNAPDATVLDQIIKGIKQDSSSGSGT
ncbi:DUF2510 domain-containing protein [Kitasatospora sp. NPDC048239]|uniref:DUF2510 domain-containing protein n=1 Tax=Kitasatospora sp. NPDC048239 TaxID=3364046 RepID=UPI00371EA51A